MNKLETLRDHHSHRSINIVNGDANEYIKNIDWITPKHRGVLFLDPFGVDVEWTTLEAIASYETFDTWILFPLSAIARLMNKTITSEPSCHRFAHTLTRIFGDDRWERVYERRDELDILTNECQRVYDRLSGVGQILDIYKDRLEDLFGERFMKDSRTLYNSKKSPLFEFFFLRR